MNYNSTSVLKLTELHKKYRDAIALTGLSLEVQAGEIYGLIGPDGAGKTSAMRIACGLLKPDAGAAWVMNINAARHPRQARERLGYMPQRFSLYPDLSIAENLRFFADLFGVTAKQRQRREEELMRFSRLGPYRKRRAGQLSGGMKQKLALMCTLIHTPRLLVLDEPTTGVDPISREEFWSLLRSLAQDGIAILVSTPYMDEAALCHKISLIHQGRTLASGSPPEMNRLFPFNLLEISGAGLKEVSNIIKNNFSPMVKQFRFGDKLHIAFRDQQLESSIVKALYQTQAQVKSVPPTMEDIFIALMS